MQENQGLLWALGAMSIVVFVGSLLLMPVLIARIPADYFAHAKRPRSQMGALHPALRLAVRIGMNGLGVVLLVMGAIMLFIPGQGILTMLAGLVLMDFPGKYRLERRLVKRRSVLRSLNWIRARAGQDPLVAPLAAKSAS